MKGKKRVLIVFIIAASVVLAAFIGVALVKWTGALSSKQRVQELRKALTEVIKTSGEKGLLEMAGIPVDNIYYGASKCSLTSVRIIGI